MPNAYLSGLQDRYNGIRESVEGLQQRSAEEQRDLTDEELTLVRSQGEELGTLATQIEELTEIERRSAKVADLAASLLTTNGDGEGENRGQVGGAQRRTALGVTAQERDPGHYRSETEGGQHSFFADLYRARMGDEVASGRLAEHQRALSTGTHGPGVVPPHWLTEEFEQLARQGRALANAVRMIPLGDDPRPLTLPKQITGTDAVVAEQATENTAVGGADAYDTDVDTVAPKPTAGKQIVSRQMLDMSTPAIDLLVYGDLIGVYNNKVEVKVCTAVKAVGTVLPGLSAAAAEAVGITSEAEFADVANAANKDSGEQLALRAAIEVRKARHMPADIVAMTVDRYGKFLALKDSTGRPLMPSETAGPMNVIGVGSVAVDGRLPGSSLGVIATDGMGTGAYPDAFCALRASDVLLFESNMLRFRYEEQAGPESIVLGIWGYTAVLVRQGTKAVKRVEITA